MRTPSLKALKIFEVVAFHSSITVAAKDLFVTPSAVSQQIRQLEQFFGEPLFIRSGKKLQLTLFGQQCLVPVREGFQRVAVGLDEVYRGRSRRRLTVSVAPSMGQMWLLPRLDRFVYRNPDVDVAIVSSTELSSLEREDVDVAIRYGNGFYPGLHTELLMRETVLAVCSPKVAAFVGNIGDPRSVLNLPLLHEDPVERDPSCPDWRGFALKYGLDDLNVVKGIRFNQSSLLATAAEQDKGIALVKFQVAHAALDAGRLVRAASYEVPVDFAYYLVCQREKRDRQPVKAFAEWLAEETALPAKP